MIAQYDNNIIIRSDYIRVNIISVIIVSSNIFRRIIHLRVI